MNQISCKQNDKGEIQGRKIVLFKGKYSDGKKKIRYNQRDFVK